MNPIEELINNFQNLVAQVPEAIQPFVVMVAGAIPFIDGEGGSIIGVIGGINPFIAAIAAAAGNFLSVLLVVLLGTRARAAVMNRQTRHAASASTSATITAGAEGGTMTMTAAPPVKPDSKGRLRLKKWLAQYGVPGASVLGPLAIPGQFTAAILVAGGTSRAWVLLWQAVSIVLWTTVGTISVWLALQVVVQI